MANHQRYYNIRLIHGAWYVHEFDQGRLYKRHGPYTNAEAVDKVAGLGLPDYDRHLEDLAKAEAGNVNANRRLVNEA